MMEPKLSDEAEAILVRLRADVEHRLLTPEQFEFLRKGMMLQESWGIIGRFMIGLAGFILTIIGIVSYFQLGVPK